MNPGPAFCNWLIFIGGIPLASLCPLPTTVG
jgi:hypothetical protein